MNRTKTVIIFTVMVSMVIAIVVLSVKLGSAAISEYSEVQRLRDENKALKFYQGVIDRNNITITYNGCEVLREQLGLDKGVVK